MNRKKFLVISILIFVFIISFSDISHAGIGNKAKWVKDKIIMLFKLPGNDTTKYYDQKGWANKTTEGFNINIPKTNFNIVTFHTRDKGLKWHIGIIFDMKNNEPKFLSKFLLKYADFLGGMKIDSFMIFISEGDGTFNLKDVSDKLKKHFEEFKMVDEYRRVRNKVKFKKGINFFATVTPPEKGALEKLERLILLGGKVKKNTHLAFTGSLNGDVLSKILGESSSENQAILEKDKKNNKNKNKNGKTEFEGLAFKITLPSIIPPVFASLDSKQLKKLFYFELGPTMVSIDWDKKSKSFKAKGSRSLNIWVLNKEFTLENFLSIGWKKEFEKGKKIVTWDVAVSGSIDLKKNPIPLLNGVVKLKSIFVKGKLQDVEKSKGGKNTPKHRKTFGMLIGSKIDIGSMKNIDSYFGIDVESKKGETEFKGIYLSIAGDIKFKKIKNVNKIPLIKNFTFKEASLGFSLNKKGIPDVYLAGALDWKKVKGQAALMTMNVKGKPEFLFISRVDNFCFSPFIKECPKIPGVSDIMKSSTTIFDAIKLPKTIFILSSIKEKDAKKSKSLLLENLPGRMQKLFDGVVTEADERIPIYGDGMALMCALDLNGVNKLLKIKQLQKVFDDMGVGEQLKRMGISGPLIVAGSIGGFRSGGLKLGLSIQLPKFKFPGTFKPITYIIQPDSTAASFFIRLNLANLQFQSGISSKLNLNVPQIGDHTDVDHISLVGDVYLNICASTIGIRVSAYKEGEWRNPFGFGNVTINDVAFLLGFDSNTSLELGFGGAYDLTIKGHRKSPIPSITNPAKAMEEIKNLYEGKGKKEISKFIDGKSKKSAARIFKAGLAGMIGLSYGGEFVYPTKLALYLQSSKYPSMLDEFELYDSLFRGVIFGPMGEEIKKQCIKGIKLVAKNKINKQIDNFNKAWKFFKEAPNLIELFHLRDLPLELLSHEDILLYLSTPGATIPGFPAIDTLGIKVMGKTFFNLFGKKYLLGAVDFRLTIADGLKIYAKLGDLNIGNLINMNHVLVDIHLGIPIINGENVPHFILSGDLNIFGDRSHALIKISNDGILVETSRKIASLEEINFKFSSVIKSGKTLTSSGGLQDFKVQAQIKKEAVDKIIKDTIMNDVMNGISNDLKNAKKTFNSAKNALNSTYKKLQKARKEVRKRMKNGSKSAFNEAKKAIKKLRNIYNGAKHEYDKCGRYDPRRLVLGKALDIAKSALNRAENNLKSLQNKTNSVFSCIPTDVDPVVVGLIALHTSQMIVLNGADLALRIAENLHGRAKIVVKNILDKALIKDPVSIKNFEIYSNSLKSGKGVIKIDMKVLGNTIKEDVKIDLKKTSQIAKETVKKLTQTITKNCKQKINEIISKAKDEALKRVKDGKPKFDKNKYNIGSGGMSGYSPSKIMHKCGISVPAYYPQKNVTAYLITMESWNSNLFLALTDCYRVTAESFPTPFILFDLNGGTLRNGDKVAILSASDRYFTLKGNKNVEPYDMGLTPNSIFRLGASANHKNIYPGMLIKFRANNNKFMEIDKKSGNILHASHIKNYRNNQIFFKFNMMKKIKRIPRDNHGSIWKNYNSMIK